MKLHPQIGSNSECVASLCMVLVVLGILLLPGNGMAANYTLSDGGSSATLNLGDGSGGTGNLGMNNWNLGTGNQLVEQWFWYSINGSAPQSIDQLPSSVLNTSYAGANNLTVQYVNSQLSINVQYVLQGANPQSADMMEYIWIDNVSGSALDVSFYQYSNFNLLGEPNTVNISGSPGAYTAAYQTAGGPGTGIGEVLVAPNANYAEAADVPQTLGELGGASYLTLDNTTSASGDVSWAFQWNATIGAGGELDISKDLGLEVMPIPEPSTLALIALGMSALGLTLRRKLA